MAEYDRHLLDGEHLGYLIGKIKTLVATKISNPQTKANGQILEFNGTDWVAVDKPISAVWGHITGTLNSQTDLKNALDAKQAVVVWNTAYDASTNKGATMTDIVNAVAGLTGFHFEIVQALPQTGETNIIYLVLKSSGESGNVYTEYAWINNGWEQLGDTQITLEYLTNAEIDTIWSANN